MAVRVLIRHDEADACTGLEVLTGLRADPFTLSRQAVLLPGQSTLIYARPGTNIILRERAITKTVEETQCSA